MDEHGAALTEMVVYFVVGNLSPKWPGSLSANFAKEGQRGRRNFMRGRLFRSGRTPNTPSNIAKKACYPQKNWHGERLSWFEGVELGSQGGDGEPDTAALASRHGHLRMCLWLRRPSNGSPRSPSACGSCLVLKCGEVCQIALPQCSWRPRRLALLPHEAVQTR